MGRTLAEATGRMHLSVGHMLREEAKKETEEAQMINQSIRLGVLVATVSMRGSRHIYHNCWQTKNFLIAIRIAETDMYSGIPISRTSRGNANWFEKSESSRSKITMFD